MPGGCDSSGARSFRAAWGADGGPEALAHLRRVNGWDESRALGHDYAAENL